MRQAQETLPGCAFDTPGVSAFFLPEALLSYFTIRHGRNGGDAAFMASEDNSSGQFERKLTILLSG